MLAIRNVKTMVGPNRHFGFPTETYTTRSIKYYRLYVILCKVIVVCSTTYAVFNTTQPSRRFETFQVLKLLYEL